MFAAGVRMEPGKGGHEAMSRKDRNTMTSEAGAFKARGSKAEVEEGLDFAPKFDANGLIPAITTDFETGALLMVAYMNAEALARTMAIGEAVYYSRSRNELWHKGATSGHTQAVREMRVDCDQDAIWLRVEQKGGACCHTGRQSCFYRSVPVGEGGAPADTPLQFQDAEKVFDPEQVYGKK